MSLLDAILGALATLRANLLRSLLTMLGIIIGVAAVMAVVAVASGARALVVGKIGNLGSNLLVVTSGTITAGGLKLSTGSAMTLTDEDARVLPHDIPVDYIVTPTRVIETHTKLPRPRGIYWEYLTQEQIDAIPYLKKNAG